MFGSFRGPERRPSLSPLPVAQPAAIWPNVSDPSSPYRAASGAPPMPNESRTKMNARAIRLPALPLDRSKTYGRTRTLAIALALILGAAQLLLTSSSAQAGWREDMGVFRIGIVARPGAGSVIEGAEPIQKAFADVLGMPVGIYVARDYGDLVDAQASGRVDYAIHTAASYATLSIQCGCVTPLVSPVSADGSTGIRAALIARAGGPVNADDIPNYRIAFGPPDSASGALLPLAEFQVNRKKLAGDEPYLLPVSSETEAVGMLAAGKADGMFGYVVSGEDGGDARGGTLDALAASSVPDPKILWTSELLRNGPHAVKKSLPSEAREMLIAFLTALKDQDERVYDYVERRFGGGFVPAAESDYESAVRMVRENTGAAAGN